MYQYFIFITTFLELIQKNIFIQCIVVITNMYSVIAKKVQKHTVRVSTCLLQHL